jgi:hypothetical protein
LTVTEHGVSVRYLLQNQLAAVQPTAIAVGAPETQHNGNLTAVAEVQHRIVPIAAGALSDLASLTKVCWDPAKLRSLT